MGKIGVEHLCKGCMSFLQYTDRPCPKCGFDEKWFYSGKEYLKVASVLNDRYLVGKVLEQNDYELVYIGWDLEANTKVTIRECFLKDTVKRDSSISNDVIVNDESRSAYFETIKENYVEDSMKLAKLGNLFGIVWTYDAIWCNNTAYVITEYIEYVTLDEFIEQRGGRMSVYEVLSYLQPVVYSLRTIHEQGIYHGNINLKSVVINANNDVVLIGFGLNPKLSETITYKDDIQGICKIIYKIICGPRYLNNLTCYKETGKLMMPNNVKDYVVNALNKGLAADGETLYSDVVELYSDVYENVEYNTDLQTVGFISNFAANRPINSMNAYNAENAQIGIQNMQYLQYNQNAVTPYYNDSYPAVAADGNKYITINDEQAYKKRNTIIIAVTAIMTVFVLAICVFVIIPESKKNKGLDSSTSSQAGSTEQHLSGAIQWKEPQIEEFVRNELNKEGNEEITESDVKSIKNVTLRTKDIKSLDDLKYFTALDTLTLNNNAKLEDISGLENLSELTELNLSNCKINDITPLKNLKKLRVLDLSGNKSLSDISVLNNLTELTTLNINNCKLEDVSVLKDVKSLRTLGLAGNKIKKINTLGKMTWLSRLDLADNGITNWDELDDIAKVNGRPYKLHVNLVYQRNMSDYEGWRIHTWRRDPKLDYDKDLPLDMRFPASTSSSKLEFDMEMVEDYFQFIIQMEERPSVKDIESNRTIDIALTKGEVSVKVCIYEANETPIVIMESE